MMYRIIFSIVILAGTGLGYLAYDKTVSVRCTEWLIDADASKNQGYYAEAIERLTLYFSNDRCRALTDADAIKTLTDARIHVPLPQNAHLGQQLELAKLGWKLKRDNQYHHMEASAALVRGNWPAARTAARKSRTAQSGLISLTASIRLADIEAAKEDLEWFAQSDASPFQWALLQELLVDEPILARFAKPYAPEIGNNIKGIAALSVGRKSAPISGLAIDQIKTTFTDGDLSTATSLLIAEGHTQVAQSLLDQPNRALTAPNLTRHARLLWKQEDFSTLSAFLKRGRRGAMPGEVHMIVCLAQLKSNQKCQNQFDAKDYQRRYGIYASSRWETLLNELAQTPIKSSRVLDALSGMKNLIAASSVAQQLAGNHYNSIGENTLSRKHSLRAAVLGLETTKPMPQEKKEGAVSINKCETKDTPCVTRLLGENSSDFQMWRTALANGFKPDAELLKKLREASPNEATLWRIAQTRAATTVGTDQSMAQSLQLIRPVLKWTPEAALPNLLASAGSAHFSDNDTTYGHLATAAKSDPDSAVAALRLSLKYYYNGSIGAAELVHWWVSITRLEMKARAVKASDARIKNLLLERLAILALESEQRNDRKLATATYEAILEISPNHHVALNNLAMKLKDNVKDIDRAEKMAIKATELNPGQPEYLRTLEDIHQIIDSLSQ